MCAARVKQPPRVTTARKCIHNDNSENGDYQMESEEESNNVHVQQQYMQFSQSEDDMADSSTSEFEGESFQEYNKNMNYTSKDVKNKSMTSSNQSSSSKTCIKSVIAVVLSGIIVVIYAKYEQIFVECKVNILYLQKQYPSQPYETWETVEAIIDDVLSIDPIHPAVFLFLYSEEKKENDKLVNSLAQYASQRLNIDDDHIDLNENEYTSPEALADYGYLINKYKSVLTKKKVMVIKNLHKMPAYVAQSLHSFCDEYTPLVDRAIYLLTLKVDSLTGNEITVAEKSLKRLWSNLDSDILMPLITRVTSTVIKIN